MSSTTEAAAEAAPPVADPTSPPTISTASKDEDAVKLFVGQIPKDMGEEDLRPVFAEFGSIFDLTVIRDKTTGHHRGCAFLTYSSKPAADAALEALHNKVKLPNAQNALQVGLFGGRWVGRVVCVSCVCGPRRVSFPLHPPRNHHRSGPRMYIPKEKTSCSWGCCPRPWTTPCWRTSLPRTGR